MSARSFATHRFIGLTVSPIIRTVSFLDKASDTQPEPKSLEHTESPRDATERSTTSELYVLLIVHAKFYTYKLRKDVGDRSVLTTDKGLAIR